MCEIFHNKMLSEKDEKLAPRGRLIFTSYNIVNGFLCPVLVFFAGRRGWLALKAFVLLWSLFVNL